MHVSTRLLSWPFVCAVVIAAFLSVPLATSHAQSRPPGPSESSSTISDQKLDAAAAAFLRVNRLKQSYQQRMAAAATPSAKESIAKEADKEVVSAITDEGLSIEEYSSIMTVARNDPEVRENLLRRLNPSTR